MKKILQTILIAQFLIFGPVCSHGQADRTFGEVNAESEQIREIVLHDEDASPIPFGGSAEFEAVTFPEGLAVNWSVQPAGNSGAAVSVVENGSFITLTPTPDSGEGFVDIEAWVHEGQRRTARIYVGCQVCGAGDCTFAGSGFVTLGSIDVRISLGKAAEGMSGGDLFIRADKPSADVFTPKSLEISTVSGGVTTLKHQGVIRQIITPQSFVIVEPSSQAAYEILFYRIKDRGDLADGFYQLKPNAEPVSAWRIENPDSTNRMFKKVLVTEFRLGAERRYEYTYLEEDSTWLLSSGNGLKIETRQEYVNGEGNRVERTLISGSDNQAVSVTEKIFYGFEWGEELIGEISDPDGDRLTTEYTYYQDGPGKGRLRQRINPDGSWIRYEYDGAGRIIKTITPYLDTRPDGDDSRAKMVISSFPIAAGRCRT